jgi:hypothetical protein
MVHHEFVAVGQTVNFFCVVDQKHLRYTICWERLLNREMVGLCTMTVLLITPPSQSVFGEEPNSTNPPVQLFSRSCSVLLLAVPEVLDRAQRLSFIVS